MAIRPWPHVCCSNIADPGESRLFARAARDLFANAFLVGFNV